MELIAGAFEVVSTDWGEVRLSVTNADGGTADATLNLAEVDELRSQLSEAFDKVDAFWHKVAEWITFDTDGNFADSSDGVIGFATCRCGWVGSCRTSVGVRHEGRYHYQTNHQES